MNNTKKQSQDIFIKLLDIIMSTKCPPINGLEYKKNIKRYGCRVCRISTQPGSIFESQSHKSYIYMKSAQIVYLYEILMKYRHLKYNKELLLETQFGQELKFKLLNMLNKSYIQPFSYRWKTAPYYLKELYGMDM